MKKKLVLKAIKNVMAELVKVILTLAGIIGVGWFLLYVIYKIITFIGILMIRYVGMSDGEAFACGLLIFCGTVMVVVLLVRAVKIEYNNLIDEKREKKA